MSTEIIPEEAEELAEEVEDLASEARGKLIGKTESDIEDEHEVEIKAEIHERDLELMFFTLVGSILQIFVVILQIFSNICLGVLLILQKVFLV